MELLTNAILQQGRVEKGSILKVDSFLNHQLDIELLNEIGKEFKRRFDDFRVDKILTIEASGIALAAITAQYFSVPVVFAKKSQSKNLDCEVYEGDVHSYTKDQHYKIRVSKRYISPGDNILIIDDFLAQGQAVLGLKQILDQAGANLVGVGIVIEKGFQEGGRLIREQNINLQSLAIIDSMDDQNINIK